MTQETSSPSRAGEEHTGSNHMTDHRPRRAGELVLIGTDRKGDLVFLNPVGPGWAALTSSAASLLSMCDGTLTISELESIFRSREPASGNESLVRRLVSLHRGG